MKFLKQKKIVALLAAAAVAIAAVGAYAYFTSTGNGTGQATVGTATAWEVAQSAEDTGGDGPLYPNALVGTGDIVTNTYHVQNNSTGAQSLNQVAIRVATSTGAVWSSDGDGPGGNPACTKDDFSVGGELVGVTHVDTSLAGSFAADFDDTSGTVTVQMIDNGLNQDNCKNVTVPLYYDAS